MMMPVFGLPRPDGPYPIGTMKRRFSETTSRTPRSVMVQLWYPAKTPCVARSIFGDWPARVITPGAGVADGTHPFLLGFSGWSGSLDDNVALSRSLASHGLVVAAVGYPTGTDIPSRWLPMDFSSASAFRTTIQLADRRARIQAEMATLVRHAIAQLGNADPMRQIADRLNTDCVGAFGFSFGGAVAAQAACHDDCIRAVMNLDGWVFADAAVQHFVQPLLLVNDDSPLPDQAELHATNAARRHRAQLTYRDARWQTAQLAYGGGYEVTIRGSRHVDFSDGPLRLPLRSIASRRSSRARRAHMIVQAYALNFFGKFLNGQSAALLDSVACGVPDADVKLKVFGCPARPMGRQSGGAVTVPPAARDDPDDRRRARAMTQGNATP
jgi:dienelactone hydrolase